MKTTASPGSRDSLEGPDEAPSLPLPERSGRRLRVRFDADPTEWTVLRVGVTHFSVSGSGRVAGAETVAVFVFADTLTMSMPCRVHPVTADGEQWFTVLKPETELMALLRRLLV